MLKQDSLFLSVSTRQCTANAKRFFYGRAPHIHSHKERENALIMDKSELVRANRRKPQRIYVSTFCCKWFSWSTQFALKTTKL